MKIRHITILLFLLTAHFLHAAPLTATDTLQAANQEEPGIELEEAIVTRRQRSVRKPSTTPTNTDLITSAELLRAACCNLGESFVTNASVDVNYSDAATGARQIKLLGLSGAYVQMLTENVPTLRGAASLYGLGYVPGTWMQSIQVSKGASSVKNGYESVTGQINVEFLKPQTEPSLLVNAYADGFGKAELNAAGNVHLGNRWSTGLLLHGENSFAAHDENGDGFMDLPKIRQFTGMNRWAYMGNSYVFQAALRYLTERRESGQHSHEKDATMHHPYTIDIGTDRWELFTKNAYIFDKAREGSVALILSGSVHSEDAAYGQKLYDVTQDNVYSSLIYEQKWHEGLHGLSAGFSLNYDRYSQHFRLTNSPSEAPQKQLEQETTPGLYAQYTLDLHSRLILMAGARYDHSSLYGSMFTPRLHAKWNILDGALILHASAGRGYKSPHALAENHFYMASSRRIVIEPDLRQEVAMNYGGGLSGHFDLLGKDFSYSAEFYYTTFSHQLLIDLDSNPHEVVIKDSKGKGNYSRTMQAEASCQILSNLNLSAAYRLTDVKADYGNGLVAKPLTSRHKALFSLSWTPRMGIWQLDATLALNGSGRMPTPYQLPDGTPSWAPNYKAYPQLNAQLTRNFPHWALYIGGENLTGYRQHSPIIDSANPWGDNFDATMIYAPIHGAMIYAGLRYTLK